MPGHHHHHHHQPHVTEVFSRREGEMSDSYPVPSGKQRFREWAMRGCNEGYELHYYCRTVWVPSGSVCVLRRFCADQIGNTENPNYFFHKPIPRELYQ